MSKKKVSIWFGKFPSQQAFDDYLALEYDEEGDATSPFLKDFDIEYLDEDFQEVSFEEGVTIQKALEGFSYIEYFVHAIPDVNSEFNSFLLAYYEAYQGEVKETEHMQFIGVFDFKED